MAEAEDQIGNEKHNEKPDKDKPFVDEEIADLELSGRDEADEKAEKRASYP